jgi:type IV secretory pathway VirB2 component (pilin)
MNFLKKPFFTFYFSIFFLISVEGWAVDVTFPLNQAGCLTTNIPCSNTCGGTSTLYVFFATQKSGATSRLGSITTSASPGTITPTTAECKSQCATYCAMHKASLAGEAGGELTYSSTSSNTFSKSICNAFRIVTGSAGKTFAAFAIIATGIGFFSGKVSWGLMIGVAAGIATMFGAPSIVAAISGTTVNTQCTLATGMSGS